MSNSRIILLAIVEGLIVMCIELSGAKQLSIYYGNTLIVWTTMLGVTMFSLAIGYFLGAYLSKKQQAKKISILVLLISISLAILLSLVNKIPAFINFDDLILNLIFVTTLILSLPLILTSILSPILIELYTEKTENSGKSAGVIFTLSTIGGIFSAYLFGFFLIPSFGLKIPILALAISLIIFSLFTIKFKFKTILLILTLYFCILSFQSLNEPTKNNEIVKIKSDGLLGELKVIDFYHSDAKQVFRKLSINNINQSEIMPNEYAQSIWTYPHIFALFSTMKGQSSNALLIGLGGGSVARELLRQNIKFDAVELDERIPELAEEFFFLRKNKYNLIVDDGRHYLNVCKKKYDLVIFDIASGEVQPNHLYSIEALTKLKNILSKNALVLVNFQGNVTNDEKGIGFRTLYKTFKTQGFNVKFWSEKRSDFSNDIIFVMSLENLEDFHIQSSKLEKCCLLKKYTQLAIKKPYNDFKPNLRDVNILTDEQPFLENINKNITNYWRKNMKFI